MKEHIIEVQSISPATGFSFSDDGASVACFALVSCISPEHPAVPPGRQIIALGEFEIGVDLIGTEITQRMQSVEQKSV